MNDHNTTAAVALLNAWEAAKQRGAVAMRWDGQQWVVLIVGAWVALTANPVDAHLPASPAAACDHAALPASPAA